MTTSDRFLATVVDWYAARNDPVALVHSVTACGSDWDGDTEGGFYSTFTVEIQAVRFDGSVRFDTVDGDDLQSLWQFVIEAGFRDAPT